jgi:hypothetical protein
LKCHQNWRSVKFVFFISLWHLEGVSDVRCEISVMSAFSEIDFLNGETIKSSLSRLFIPSSQNHVIDHVRCLDDSR